MNKKQTILVILLIVSTIVLGMGVNSVDTVLSCIGNDNPLVYEGTAETLFF